MFFTSRPILSAEPGGLNENKKQSPDETSTRELAVTRSWLTVLNAFLTLSFISFKLEHS